MVLRGRLRVMATALVPLINRAECFFAFQTHQLPSLRNKGSASARCTSSAFARCSISPQNITLGSRAGWRRTISGVDSVFRSRTRTSGISLISHSSRLTAAANSRSRSRYPAAAMPKPRVTRRSASTTETGAEVLDTGQHDLGLTMNDAREALRSLFGHDDFRDGQVRDIRCH